VSDTPNDTKAAAAEHPALVAEKKRPFAGILEDALELRGKLARNEIAADGPYAVKTTLELVTRIAEAMAAREAR
jgi:hypothetical protein